MTETRLGRQTPTQSVTYPFRQWGDIAHERYS